MRIFPDTNVLISAFLSSGTCYQLIRHVISHPGHELIVGTVVLGEAKGKLRSKIRAPEHEIELFVQALLAGSPLHPLPEHPAPVPVRDPDDAPVLASALEAGCDVLVTGDRDLLDVADSVEGLEILTPRALWERVQAEDTGG